MLAHRHQNRKRQHQSHVLFVDESIVRLYTCNGHVRVIRHVAERLLDCCIPETDGIRGHDDQSGRGWHWTRHRISHETSADGSSFGACMPTCGSGIDYDESVCGIILDVSSDIQLLLNALGPCGHRQVIQVAWLAPPWPWTLRKKKNLPPQETEKGTL